MRSILDPTVSTSTNAIKTKLRLPQLLIPIAFLLLTLVVQSAQWGWLNIDGSAFWYEGQQILRGKVPYRDMWDHKPPLIYYYDALILLILPAKPEFLHLTSLILAWATSMFFYLGLKRCVRAEVAVLIGLLFTFYLNLPDLNIGFFYTENLQVFLLSVAFYYFVCWCKEDRNWQLFIIGLFCGLAMLTKQTDFSLIIVTLGLVVRHNLKEKRLFNSHILKQLLWLGLPLVIPALLFVLYFWVVGAWNDFLDQNINYNRVYIATTSLSEILTDSTASIIRDLGTFALLLPAIIIYAVPPLLHTKRRIVFLQQNPFVLMTLFWIALDWITVNLSGRGYGHYYLQLLMPLAFGAAFMLNRLWELLVVKPSYDYRRAIAFVATFGLIVLFSSTNAQNSLGLSYSHWIAKVLNPNAVITQDDQPVGSMVSRLVSDYFQNDDKISAGSSVYVWGRGAQINLLSNTVSPDKFFYDAPLITQDYASPALYSQLLHDLQNNLPQYLVDTGFPDYLLTPAQIAPRFIVDQVEIDRYIFDPVLHSKLKAFLTTNYNLEKIILPGSNYQVLIYCRKS